MKPQVISATEASRSLSDLLNKVHYQGETFDIKRGREVIARIMPISTSKNRLKVTELNEFFKALPLLDKNDRDDFEQTLNEIRESTRYDEDDTWG